VSTDRDWAPEAAIEIRPGVLRPDWSAVTSPHARDALAGRLAARSGPIDPWSHRLGQDEDLVWRTLLRRYASAGRAPRIEDIAGEIGISAHAVALALRELRSHDLIGLDEASGHIRMAYPFTESVTEHRVELDGHALHALCAIDALGVAAMYGKDTRTASRCHHCREPIEVTTAMEGRALGTVAPVGAVVWYDFAFDGCAASSSCPSITFFCSPGHLVRWWALQAPRRNGVQLTMGEALEVGRAIFGPVLAEPKMRGRES
jgi:hypothetical protein